MAITSPGWCSPRLLSRNPNNEKGFLAMPTMFSDYVAAFDTALLLEQRTGQHHEVREYGPTSFVIVKIIEA